MTGPHRYRPWCGKVDLCETCGKARSSPVHRRAKATAADEQRAREALARAGADWAINLARTALAFFDTGEITYMELLNALGWAGREAALVATTARWDFLDERVAV